MQIVLAKVKFTRAVNELNDQTYLFVFLCYLSFRFSQSGNLNRHMRVHGTNAMIT